MPDEIIYTAQRLSDLGGSYPEGSTLRAGYYARAATLYERAGNHAAAISREVRFTAEELRSFGAAYHDRADALLRRLELTQ
jgi:hypothetical protein